MSLLQWSGIPVPKVDGEAVEKVASLHTYGLLGNLL
jgi:hypothetical protein